MDKKSSRNQAEWISLAISSVLLTGVVATVISLWLDPSQKPAQFSVETGEIRYEGNHYYLPVTITNEGDATGAQVTVEGTVETGSDPEVSNTTFDFVPARSDAEGVLIFSQDPTSAKVRVVSYQKP